jgi:glycopeptide antibiotics resistance protein
MVALVAAMGFIAALTLLPGSPLPYRYLADLTEPWIDPGVLAASLNVLLFVPLGMLIGAVGRPLLLFGAIGASVAVEVVQVLIPGRSPRLDDVATNSLGACLGYLAVIVGCRLAERRAAGREQPLP